MLRQHRAYPRRETLAGVQAAGDMLMTHADSSQLTRDCAVVTWNNYGLAKRFAGQCKQAGGKHVVMENGYLKREAGYYLMNLDGFNGNEKATPNDSPARWDKLGIELKPWVKDGAYILVCAQRGKYNYSPMAMPSIWPDAVLNSLRKRTSMKLVYKPHPERVVTLKQPPSNCEVLDHRTPLSDCLPRAFAVVVWTSNAATDALINGVPVFYCGPTIACADLATKGINTIEQPRYPEREKTFYDLAWRQWHVNELQSGKAWRYVTQ
jgi:hypothetical protein